MDGGVGIFISRTLALRRRFGFVIVVKKQGSGGEGRGGEYKAIHLAVWVGWG